MFLVEVSPPHLLPVVLIATVRFLLSFFSQGGCPTVKLVSTGAAQSTAALSWTLAVAALAAGLALRELSARS